jgi:hypothetical protein
MQPVAHAAEIAPQSELPDETLQLTSASTPETLRLVAWREASAGKQASHILPNRLQLSMDV